MYQLKGGLLRMTLDRIRCLFLKGQPNNAALVLNGFELLCANFGGL